MSELVEQLPGSAEVAAAWDLGRWRRQERLAAGRNNDSFHLVTDRGEYVLRRLREGKTADDLGFELALIRWLAAHGLPMAEIVRAADGAEWREIAGRLWNVTRFIRSEPAPEPNVLAALAGEVLARFHLVAAKFRAPLPVPGEQDRLALAGRILDRLDGLANADVLASAIDRARRAVRRAAIERNRRRGLLASGIIYGGCRRSSLLIRDARVAALLDMDSARLGPCAEDLGIALASFAKRRSDDAAMDAPRGAVFCRAYSALRPICAEETEAVPVYLAQALIYAFVKWMERAVCGHADLPHDFAKGSWRLAAAERALDRPEDVVRCVRAQTPSI